MNDQDKITINILLETRLEALNESLEDLGVYVEFNQGLFFEVFDYRGENQDFLDVHLCERDGEVALVELSADYKEITLLQGPLSRNFIDDVLKKIREKVQQHYASLDVSGPGGAVAHNTDLPNAEALKNLHLKAEDIFVNIGLALDVTSQKRFIIQNDEGRLQISMITNSGETHIGTLEMDEGGIVTLFEVGEDALDDPYYQGPVDDEFFEDFTQFTEGYLKDSEIRTVQAFDPDAIGDYDDAFNDLSVPGFDLDPPS